MLTNNIMIRSRAKTIADTRSRDVTTLRLHDITKVLIGLGIGIMMYPIGYILAEAYFI